MSGSAERIVIVGAGHAGGTAAALLRQLGWAGAITLIGAEPVPPYQRPPLSKAWLKGEATIESLALKPESFYAANRIELRLGVRAETIDRQGRRVMLAGGETISYDRLILATGVRLRQLAIPGIDLAPVLELRTSADAERIKAVLGPGRRLAVIGGGYVGLEVAASARALGAEATVIEREERLLARVASPPIASFFADCHRRHGVGLELAASVAEIAGTGGRVSAVRLASGRTIPCDAVVVGVGALAEDALARETGLTCDDGIVVDGNAQTSDPAVYAIGDCTRRPLPHYARTGRLESVPSALEQARQAAGHICGRPVPPVEVPWFWSDQYDVHLQIAGLAFDVARLVVRGDPASGKFAVFHLGGDGRLKAVEAVNAGAEYMAGRLMIGKGTAPDPVRLADPSVPIKQLMA